jgi:hypothetical protein
VSFILSQRSISDPSWLSGSVSFDLSQFGGRFFRTMRLRMAGGLGKVRALSSTTRFKSATESVAWWRNLRRFVSRNPKSGIAFVGRLTASFRNYSCHSVGGAYDATVDSGRRRTVNCAGKCKCIPKAAYCLQTARESRFCADGAIPAVGKRFRPGSVRAKTLASPFFSGVGPVP